MTHPTSEPRLDEALPCPFCGEVCVTQDTHSGFKWGAIICTKCCAAGPEVRTEYKAPAVWYADAVVEWNRRALPVPSAPSRLPEKVSAKLPENAEAVLVDVCQLLDGWHQDGTAWSAWDESVRKRVAALLALYRPAGETRAGDAEALLAEFERAILKSEEAFEYPYAQIGKEDIDLLRAALPPSHAGEANG